MQGTRFHPLTEFKLNSSNQTENINNYFLQTKDAQINQNNYLQHSTNFNLKGNININTQFFLKTANQIDVNLNKNIISNVTSNANIISRNQIINSSSVFIGSNKVNIKDNSFNVNVNVSNIESNTLNVKGNNTFLLVSKAFPSFLF